MPSVLPSRMFGNGYGSPPSWSLVLRIPHGRRQPGWSLLAAPWMADEACSSSFHVALFAKVLLDDLLLSVPCKRSFNAVRRRAGAHQ